MPEISRFFGIIIRMFTNEHGKPHFHAFYQDYQVSIEIESGVIAGRFPPNALRLVQDWRELHREQLLECWSHGMLSGTLNKIEPLE